MEKLKIAVLAPLTRPINSDPRGARAKVVFDLVHGLVQNGHQVTTFATGNSELPGRLMPISPKAIFQMENIENIFYQHVAYLCKMMDEVIKHQAEFDIIHSHLYPEVFPATFSEYLHVPLVLTPHQFISGSEAQNFIDHPKNNYVAISDFQIKAEPRINFVDKINCGIELSEFEFNAKPEDYLLFFGRIGDFLKDGKRIDPKGVTTAIQIAKKSGLKLKIAGNIGSKPFFEREVKPYLDDQIEFVGAFDFFGPIDKKQKVELYKNAKAFLFPINHIEAFGMTILESLACGTPVIGSDLGATREAVIDGKTGFLFPQGDINAAVEAVGKIDQINRLDCRRFIEDNFTSEKMVKKYEELYQKILSFKKT